MRQAFLENALDFNFRFTVSHIDKRSGPWRIASRKWQHWATATSLAADLRATHLENERPERPLREVVLVDQNDDQEYLGEIRKAFQGLKSNLHPEYPLTAGPRFRKSHTDEVLQLVDMVCGAVGAWLDSDERWYLMIAGRCVGMTLIP